MENEVTFNTPGRRVVYGEGPKDAKMVLVGEALGKDEAKKGRPFVGKAGRLLDTILQWAKIHRSECYITNVIKERPTDNQISRFIDLRKKDAVVTDQAAQYIAYLKAELERIDPNVVVALGNTPMYALCGISGGITKFRGSILESTLIPGMKVIPAIHPSACFRQYLWRHYVWTDLDKAKKEAEYPEIRRPQIRYRLAPSFGESMEYLQECLQEKRVAFDIEVDSGTKQLTCISFAKSSHDVISIPFVEKHRAYFTPDQEYRVLMKIAEVLESPEVESAGHNVIFDASFLYSVYGIKSQNLHCTMMAHKILVPDFKHGLDFITSTYTQLPYYKDVGEDKFRTGKGSDEDFWLYNAKDSIVVAIAYPQLLDELEQRGNLETYQHQRKLLQPLLYMGERGIKMDAEGLQEKREEMETKMLDCEQRFAEIAGKQVNLGSPDQLKQYFYIEQGIEPYRSSGSPTTNAKAMKKISVGQRGNCEEEASLVLAYREAQTMASRYYGVELDEDERLRCAWKPVGTRYGRLSSSKTIFNRGMNQQNQPYEMKKYMLVDGG